MSRRHLFQLLTAAAAGLVFSASPALARNPPNPYSSFNLSGINYGSMQWERDQRDGKVVWPYYNVPQRGTAGPAVSTGGRTGGAGNAAVLQRGGRGWRRGRR
ncbi:MAG: hypothetical protein WCH79_16440 [Planctomycetia bacterium]